MSARDLPAVGTRERIDVVDAAVIGTRPGTSIAHADLKPSNVLAVERTKAKGVEVELRFNAEPTADVFRQLRKYIDYRIDDLADDSSGSSDEKAA